MREILFRGKRVDNGEWVFGDLLHNCDCVKIRENETEINHVARSFPVLPKTIGQYTGLTDKNGSTKIFEHDIIKIKYPFDKLCNEVVSWNVEGARWDFGGVDAYFANPQKWAEVIGNVFDNPELLKGD